MDLYTGDLCVGQTIIILASGNFSTTIIEVNDNKFRLEGDSWPNKKEIWYDKNVLRNELVANDTRTKFGICMDQRDFQF
jgi:hypothetical protein